MQTHASIAERVAFGRPADADELAPIRVAPRPATALVARIFLGAIFVMSGIAKLTDHTGTVQHMEHAGIPAADTLCWIAGIAEVAGGLAVIFGFLTRLAGIGLIIFTVLATVSFHNFWSFTGDEQKMQMVQFMKNLAILGGLFLLVANGPGHYSIDAKIRRPIEA